MNADDKIYVAGHRGMVGSAIMRKLQQQGYKNLITKTSSELDLREQPAVNKFFEISKPQYVFLAAAKVGGIAANNNYRAQFIYDNLMIQANTIHAAYNNNVKKLLFLGSSCIYPRLAPQPLKEDALLTGLLEPTNKSYALAKIAGIEMCDAYRAQYGCNFISVMPANLYGPNDNYNPETSHVLPALLRKFITAKKENKPFVQIWGSGTPKREFLHVDDLAGACYFLMQNYNDAGHVNAGVGKDISVMQLALLLKEITGYTGDITTDTTKPDGTPQKLLDISKITGLGWQPAITLREGIQQVYQEVISKNWV